MNEYIVKTAVALIFFNRPHTVKYVFDEIRKAKPSVLFLIKDGPRTGNNDDLIKNKECERIVENIDWECEVIKDYSDINMGCGRRVSSGINNAFKKVDRLIILEDDVIPSSGFFRFCDELLEKYENDTRISRITGMCHMVEYKKSPYTYAFSNCSSCTGWATWKRCWNDMDYEVHYVEDEYISDCFKNNLRYKIDAKSMHRISCDENAALKRGERVTGWAHQFAMGAYLNNKLDIVPCKNLVKYIGVSEGSTHSSSSIRQLPREMQKMCNAKVFDLPEEIQHPPFIMEDVFIEKEIKSVIGELPGKRLFFRIESYIRRIVFREKK